MDGIPEDPPTVRDDLPPYARGLGTSFECPGEEIGPYTLVSPLGEGGFGSVWLARRRAPFEQKVALKVIKPGMDSRSVLSRFEQERQALALMEHPSIAKVYDGGLTPRGRPYFAMEYVKGEPITAFCDRLRLGIEDRLRLFSEACEAVQHAHLKGIVHRDLKPSNILAFQTEGGEARLKVIDFGVAKAMGPSLTGETVFTEPGLMLGTPEYMSPEQADPGMGGIDTRSDIFSLGVLLYELLVGATPWDGRELRKRAQREIQRILREEDPPTPSARLSTLVTHDRDSAGRIESTRKSRAEDLVRRLRGELEWIPLKAMRKEPHHRYQTALSLAEDVRNYLEGKPLLAGPESTAYRARKYLRRHAALATGAAAVATALLAGMAGVWWQWSRAERALVAERERAEELTAVSDFQSEMLRQIDVFEAGTALMADLRDRHAGSLARSGIPEAETAGSADSFRAELARVNGTDAAVSVIDAIVLRPATKAIEDRFGDKPVVAARLRQALADVYANLGLFEEAEPLQVSSLETRRKWLGEFDPETLESLDRLGVLRAQQARYEESEELLVGALEARRRILGEDRKETIDSIANLGWLRHLQMRLDETESLYREALAASRRVLGKDHPETLVSMGNLAALLRTRSSWAESESLYREAIDTRRRISGDDDPDTISLLGNYGSLLLARGRLEEAEAICREVLEQSGRVWGEDHPRTLTALNNLGRVLSGRQQAEAAESCYRDVLARRRRLLGDGHPDTLTSIHNLGAFLRARGRFDEAEALLGEAFAGRGRTLGPNHLQTLDTMSSIGVLRMARDRLDEAEPLLAAVLERRRASLGSKDLLTLLSIGNMGTLRRLQGRLPEAESLYLEMLETSRSELGPYHAQTLSAIVSLGDVRLAAGRPDDAGPLLDGALEAECRRVFGDRDPQTMVWVLNRGRFLLDRGRHEEAVALLVPAEPTMRLVFTDGNRPKLAVFLVTLARGTIGLGHDADRFRSAESDLLEAHAMLVETRGASHADTRDCVQGLIDLYASWDAAEPGAGFADRASEWRSRLDPVAD